VIIWDGKIVVGVLLAGSKFRTHAYIAVAGGLDADGVEQILQEWQNGKVSGHVSGFRWREETAAG
jgi:hypothetical protein